MDLDKIYLNKDKNSGYYELLNEYFSLIEKWNELSQKIIIFKVPKLFQFRVKKKFLSIGKDIENYEKIYLDWSNKAKRFFINPKFYFESNQKNKELVFNHSINILQNAINELMNRMTLLVENYHKVANIYGYRLNFNIAIIAFIISFIALVFSVYALFNEKNISDELIALGIPQKIETIESEQKKNKYQN